MKTKKKATQSHPSCVLAQLSKQKITSTTLPKLGMELGKMMDLMNNPKMKEETFRQIFTQSNNSMMLSASNDDMFISFTIEWKGVEHGK